MERGTRIILTAKTEKAEQILKKVGETWVFLEQKKNVGFTTKDGPWMYITPENRTTIGDYSRWVHAFEDKNFKVNTVGFNEIEKPRIKK